jgi:putative methionine-R-sulfoxide reductase with GAF domain
MILRTLPSFAYALGAASGLDEALISLADALGESDRETTLVYLRVDPRTGLVRERLIARDGRIDRLALETAVEQLPSTVLRGVQEGGSFVEVTDQPIAYARALKVPEPEPGGLMLLRGVRAERQLVAMLAVVEPKRVFGTKVTERLGPLVSLFELAHSRFTERDAREEAVRTLEVVTQRIHAEHEQRLAELEQRMMRQTSALQAESTSAKIGREREEARRAEDARRAARQLAVLEDQLTASIGQLEQAHVELHRRSEVLRQRTRTLYLLDRVLTIAATSSSPRSLVDSLLALLGDDMQALRCSIFLRRPDDGRLYLAAARGLPPEVTLGFTIEIGKGIAGRVAASREPLLVVDVAEASAHQLLKDPYMTSGSFISFPLVHHDALVGVVNLTNRVQRGLFVEEDVERVRLLGLVVSLVAVQAELPERLARNLA